MAVNKLLTLAAFDSAVLANCNQALEQHEKFVTIRTSSAATAKLL